MNTLKNNLKSAFLILLSTFILTGCSDDDNPEVVIQEEVITTLTATLVPVGGGTTITFKSLDLDGKDGPNPPVFTVSGDLLADTTYNGSMEILNETESPAEDITEEIKELDEEHQFFFQATNSLATFTYVDFDSNSNPLGLEFTLTTSATPGSGTITITLRHEPNKSASGVSDGDITNAGGETDVQAIFPIIVK
ncbi:type 1 periplasmic binding fold superfamily protein [Flavivirga amylovorans]|uniref:Type 1 periplasmic binding fold superfamily protein n=1 Tax=Flavivirga amylovorans TaxID=870486 RepID=A0ABT8X4J0_9FLAO|nr:type 1 periplasmic binding fold superfamily protein [Flavivirga amylovorans]MDO5988613.1 type 1 periplasmic binding fold superfamily protein [Flavivirga amylovorans]